MKHSGKPKQSMRVLSAIFFMPEVFSGAAKFWHRLIPRLAEHGVIVDVLYLLDADHELALLDACVAELAPTGSLVIKETDVVPRLKHTIARLQEIFATRVFRITAGESLAFTPIGELADHLGDQGLSVTVRRVDSGYPHPHSLLVARRRPS